jgi:hypothetical protein
MVNDIIKGIAKALSDMFGSDYRIYVENVPQGFEEPCFSIVPIMGDRTAKSPNRYLSRNKFDIHYFPKDEHQEKREMLSVGESLFLSLEYINVLDNLCRGTKMSYEIIDGVLHFFVNYDLFVVKDMSGVEKPTMETLEHDSTEEVNNGN